jgi:nickel transport protein
MRRMTLSILLATLWSFAASAHDLWLTTTPDQPMRAVVNYGHPNDRSLPEAEKVLDLRAITADRTVSLIADLTPATALGNPVLTSTPIDVASALLAAEYDNGFFVKTANGYRNTSRRLFPDAADSLWSIKFAKTVLGATAPWDRVLGQELELVPEANPANVEPGGRLRVHLLFRGRALANAQVERGDGITPIPQKEIPVFTTDNNGIADSPIEKPGPQLLAVDHLVKPSGTPELADSDLYNATLFFTVSEPK